MLANAASNLCPSNDFSHDNFFVELIYKTLIPNNITNWRIFEDDKQIINFLHSEDTFKGSIIDDEQHEALLQASNLEDNPDYSNVMPKSIIKLEKLFDIQDKSKIPTITNMNNSSLRYVVVNISTKKDPQTINIGINYTHVEKETFMRLFKYYKDFFTWTYEDLKSYDTNIIQHVIPLKEDAKPFQHKLRKILFILI